MRCPRCQGCLYHNGEDLLCINCGHYPLNVPYPEPIRDPYGRKETGRCRLCTHFAERGLDVCRSHKEAS